ncbi:MAG: hypothetical protein H0V89_09605, partial [Deltaproteobacteria bacterium]|nr:hypothetical protein [Deltaproteobacteria bacterium]
LADPVAAVPVVVAGGKAQKAPKEPKPGKAVAVVPVVPVAAAPAPVPEPEPVVADADEPVEEARVEEEPKPEREPRAAKEKPEPSLTSSGAMVIDRQRPWEKTPLLIGGSVLVAGAGVLYWQALGHRDDFYNSPDVDTTEEVLAAQSAANTLTLASSAVLAAGVGALTWGVILEEGFRLPVVNVRW